MKEFDVRNYLSNVDHVWGGGHTLDSDPFTQGWRIKKIRTARADGVLLGIPGIKGCASVVSLSGGMLDGALYDEMVEDVAQTLRDGIYIDARYTQVSDGRGWGLWVLEKLKKDLAE